MGNNYSTCCCSRNKESGLLSELGLNNQQTEKESAQQNNELFMTQLKEKISLFKSKFSKASKVSQNMPALTESQIYEKGYGDKILHDIDEEYPLDELKKHRKMLASISTLSRKTGFDQDDCELISANQFYSNGKYLLNIADIKPFQYGVQKISPRLHLMNKDLQNLKRLFVHEKIYMNYQQESIQIMNQRISQNQTIIIDSLDKLKSHRDQNRSFNKEDDAVEQALQKQMEKIIALLKQSTKGITSNSHYGIQRFAHISHISFYYQTQNSLVFRVDQPGYNNIVIKVPKEQRLVNNKFVEDLIYETQLQKLIYDSDYINEVKEEIILINTLDQTLESYIAIQEEATHSLFDLQFYDSNFSKGVWFYEEKQKEFNEFYSLPKYLFYIQQTMETLQYVQSCGIIVGCITPKDIMIDSESQKVKFRNFSFSIIAKKSLNIVEKGALCQISNFQKEKSFNNTLMQEEGDENEFYLKFFNEFYCSKKIVKIFQEKYGREILKSSKQTAMTKFVQELMWTESVLQQNDLFQIGQSFCIENIKKVQENRQFQFQKLQTFIEKKLLNKTKYFKNSQILTDKIDQYLVNNLRILNFLVDQFQQENKIQAAIDVCSKAINNLNENANDSEEGLKVQQNLINFHVKRAKLRKIAQQQKNAIKDIKQALFIYSIHFIGENQKKAELMLELVDMLIDQQEFNDANLKLISASQLIQENNLLSDWKIGNQLYSLYGKMHGLKDDTQKALNYYQEAFLISQENLGSETLHYILAESLKHIAEAQKQKNSFEESKVNLQQFEKEAKGLYGERSIQYGRFYFEYGQVEYEQGNYDQAIKCYLKFLSIHKLHFCENSSGRAQIYSRLGNAFREKHQYQKALKLIMKALEIEILLYGEISQETSITYNNLGLLYKAQGQYERALEYFMKEVKIQEIMLANNTQELGTSYNNIGNIYKSLKQYDSAIDFYEKSLRMKMKNQKNNEYHLGIATTLNNLGLAYKCKEQYWKAIKYYKDALHIKQKLLDKDHPLIANSYGSLAVAYLMINKHDKALEYSQQEMDIMLYQYGENDVNVALSLQRMGNIYYGIGNSERALEFLQKARNILRGIPTFQRNALQRENLQKIESFILECGGSITHTPPVVVSQKHTLKRNYSDFTKGKMNSPPKANLFPSESSTVSSTVKQNEVMNKELML